MQWNKIETLRTEIEEIRKASSNQLPEDTARKLTVDTLCLLRYITRI